jgi:hypothetical protein
MDMPMASFCFGVGPRPTRTKSWPVAKLVVAFIGFDVLLFHIAQFRHPVVAVFKADDVVFAQVCARLHLDDV